MKIVIGGKPGTGKSTIGKLLAKKLNYKHYSNGDLCRKIAEEKGISIMELTKLAEVDRSIDEMLDKRQKELGDKEDNFVIDSRIGFHFIKNSKSILLEANIEVRAKRILNDRIRKEKNANLEETKKNILEREKSELKRYKKYYNLDPYNPENYDFMIDTTSLTTEQTVAKIMQFVS